MEEGNKNKRRVHFTPKEFEEIFKDYEEYYNKDNHLKALCPIYDDPSYIELKKLSPRQLHLLSNDSVNPSNLFKELANKSVKADIDKSLRGMTVAYMYVDDTYYNLPEPPDATAIEVIQSTDYERLNRIVDCFSYSHRISDALIMNYMMQEKEGKNNDINAGKVSYRCSIPYNNSMYNTNHNENVPARGRRFRHH